MTLRDVLGLESVIRLLTRDGRQQGCHQWCIEAFGQGYASNLPQRAVRLLEEAVELYQACGGQQAMAENLVAYVFRREPGKVFQELGGVAVTTLALAEAAGLSADEAEVAELARVMSLPIEHFKKRNEVKNEAGFNVAVPA